jgi:hypothetical protein
MIKYAKMEFCAYNFFKKNWTLHHHRRDKNVGIGAATL